MSVELLYRALDARLGIVVSTNNPERLRARLYAARSSAQNPEFDELSILPSRTQPQSELWIVRKAQPTESATNAPQKV